MKTWDDYKSHVKSLREKERRNMENIEELAELTFPSYNLKALGSMTRKELTAEILKSIDSLKAGRVYTAEEVDKILEEDFIKR
ncbi:hypothetical protein LK430_08875 [Acidaminococcus fermentans DSM 20731]|uniref:Uncharacterized protein n=1 Tax=Acidaminococcus fermentans (strain ATCC 25085 / DSM 20731 / CCUG 9996 / CIP 106432 / VR4) TaxID=591001 RepID=D2RK32_ACIFV|nr:hypothetical protein [Acidaminococcus fermentans]ADB47434.1 hypothetical protein Acfer_1065 [Acidaminococcus fermentans DSM 20731]UEA71952.1 hypothetical protein LK430_08875 [Acidaminococcus fermentans DSM 20731]